MRFASSMEPSVWRPAAVAFRERILGLVRGSINAKGQLTHDPVRPCSEWASRQVTRSTPSDALTPRRLRARRATRSSTSSSSTTSSRSESCCGGRLGRACWCGAPRPLSRCSGKVEAGKRTRTAGTTTRASCTAASLASSTACGGCATCSGAVPSARRTSTASVCTSGRCSTSLTVHEPVGIAIVSRHCHSQ